jgi:Ras-related protein Rab-4B
MYSRVAAGALLVFDITSRDSFLSIESRIQDLLDFAPPYLTMVLIGNKVDLKAKREVSEEEARGYAESKGMKYFETSALTGANVSEPFMACALEIKRKVNTGEICRRSSAEPVGLEQPPHNAGCHG